VWGISSCKTDIVRLTRKLDKVRFTHITDFAYNGQKTLVPSGPIYAMFTVFISAFTSFPHGESRKLFLKRSKQGQKQ
jgi:hypothetical protein